ncbi:MAG: NAD(P)/FAD-dependent oxidoreductase [Candidatus Woesearchaeota archaeon]
MIIIAGAGPSGSHTAYLLAKAGFEVEVHEEHAQIGKPVQCTGIVTPSIKDLIKVPNSCITNTVDRIIIFSPSGTSVDLKLTPNIILDRAVFDQYLAEKAMDAGVSYNMNSRFVGFKNGKAITSKCKKGKRYDAVVGADGPLSLVAKKAGMWGNREFFTGIQVRAKLSAECVKVYLGDELGWVVPESDDVARIGILARNRPRAAFDRFVKRVGKAKILGWQSGLVPVYNPKLTTQAGNVYLVGDAATMVKATTGGGIIQGLLGARALADSIAAGSDYQSEWKKLIGRELYFALVLRRILDRFSENDYDNILKFANQKGVKHLLRTYDRDFMSKMLPGLILETIKYPKIWYAAKYLFKHNIYI